MPFAFTIMWSPQGISKRDKRGAALLLGWRNLGRSSLDSSRGEAMKESEFRDTKTMTKGELTDPDYRLRQLQKQDKQYLKGRVRNKVVSCSRCHHCRR